jgi:3-methylcrotonyl-CoA carboxylase alpha subunit
VAAASAAAAATPSQPLFEKLLIANRGEIACRITRTARRLGIKTVAVYSTADAGAQHVQEADEAICIGPAPTSESYLRPERLVEAAQRTGAQAVHPGYGFLSESAEFAEALEAAGLTFVGPPSGAIRSMGSKANAKAIMSAAGVPVAPPAPVSVVFLEQPGGDAASMRMPSLAGVQHAGWGLPAPTSTRHSRHVPCVPSRAL